MTLDGFARICFCFFCWEDVGWELDGPFDEVRLRPPLAQERALRQPFTKPPNAAASSAQRIHFKAWHSSTFCNLMSSEFFAFFSSMSNLCFSASVPKSVVVLTSDVLPSRVLIPEQYPLIEGHLVQNVLMKARSRMKQSVKPQTKLQIGNAHPQDQ